ncbi:MAG: DUF1326 domain-containing protein [Pseudomonadota bacterium]
MAKHDSTMQKAIRLLAPRISSKMPATGTDLVPADVEDDGWAIQGELALNCSCDVFCPCDVSLGVARPTHGYCQAWMAFRIDDGHYKGLSLDGLNVALLLDIPGRMAEGGWTVALYVDDKASDGQVEGLEMILSGQAGGTTGLLRLLVANFLGTKRVPVTYEVNGHVRTVTAGKAILASIEPIGGVDPDSHVTINNTKYWMSSTITIAKGLKSRLRDFGRNWDFEERSAQVVDIDWKG